MTTATHQTKAEARMKLVEEHFRAENEHNVNAILDTFGPQPTMILNGQVIHSAAVVRQAYESLGFGERGSFSDLHSEITHCYMAEDSIVVELIVTGKHTGDFQGLAPTNKQFTVAACKIFTFDEQEKIASEKVYYDNLPLLKQLGAFP